MLLVVRVAVDRHHRAVHEAEGVANDLHHRHEAVRRARRVRDDVVLRRVVLVAVDAHHDGDVLALRGRGDDHLLRAAGRCASARPRRFVKRPVDSSTMSTPRSFHGSVAGSFSASTWISSPSTVMPFGRRRDVAVVGPVHRVVLEEVRERLRVREVVDGDEVEVRDALLLRGAKDLPPDAAEAVDADANCHAVSILRKAADHSRSGRPAECHVADDARAALQERGGARVQRRGGRDHVVDEHDVRAAQPLDTALETANAPATLLKRSPGVNRVCVSVSRARATASRHTGMRQSRRARARAARSG